MQFLSRWNYVTESFVYLNRAVKDSMILEREEPEFKIVILERFFFACFVLNFIFICIFLYIFFFSSWDKCDLKNKTSYLNYFFSLIFKTFGKCAQAAQWGKHVFSLKSNTGLLCFRPVSQRKLRKDGAVQLQLLRVRARSRHPAVQKQLPPQPQQRSRPQTSQQEVKAAALQSTCPPRRAQNQSLVL